jgi:catechol 2,3-dioxygenase-like lactoylglutathione lyase family enzyme
MSLDTAEMFTCLPASDLQRAVDYYREKLNIKPVQESEGVAIYEGFILYYSEFVGTNKATSAGFNVKDLRKEVDELSSKGVQFEDYGEMNGAKPDNFIYDMGEGMRVAWFKDCEGNIIALNEM